MPGWGRKYHPDQKPKRPMCAYAFYVQESYRYQTRMTGIRDAASVFPILAMEWRGKTEEEKLIYKEFARKDKIRYEEEMMQYFKLINDGKMDPMPRQPRKTSQRGYPKMTKNAFVYFSDTIRQQIRDENPDMSYIDIMRELGRRWRTLNIDKKEEFMRQSDDDKRRYKAEKRRFIQEQRRQRRLLSKKKGYERLIRLTKINYSSPQPS